MMTVLYTMSFMLIDDFESRGYVSCACAEAWRRAQAEFILAMQTQQVEVYKQARQSALLYHDGGDGTSDAIQNSYNMMRVLTGEQLEIVIDTGYCETFVQMAKLEIKIRC